MNSNRNSNKKLTLILEDNLLKKLEKNADKESTSLKEYVTRILKEFINAK